MEKEIIIIYSDVPPNYDKVFNDSCFKSSSDFVSSLHWLSSHRRIYASAKLFIISSIGIGDLKSHQQQQVVIIASSTSSISAISTLLSI
jgi:hypothetical protein